jgi:hypothetical protein
MRRAFLLLSLSLSLTLAACGDSEPAGQAPEAEGPAAPDTVTAEAAPVRIGEMGQSFAACTAAGTTRRLAAGERLPVRSAPFDEASQTGAIAAGARFFICTRSLDQKWLGVVYAEDGTLAARCGVSDPVETKRAYAGPCRSGWVTSALVKTIAGNEPDATDPNRPGSPAPEAAANGA